MKKRIIGLILTLSMLFGVIPAVDSCDADLGTASVVIEIATPSVAEARDNFGKRLQRQLENNAIRFVDRVLRAHEDNYVSDIRYWHRYERNQQRKLRDAVNASSRNGYNVPQTQNVYVIEAQDTNGERYALAAVTMQREMNAYEKAAMQKLANALKSGNLITPSSYNERRLIKKFARESGTIGYEDVGAKIHVWQL